MPGTVWLSHPARGACTTFLCYEAGEEYAHGGLSPLECVVPIPSVRGAALPEAPIAVDSVTWRGLRCTVAVSGAQIPMVVASVAHGLSWGSILGSSRPSFASEDFRLSGGVACPRS